MRQSCKNRKRNQICGVGLTVGRGSIRRVEMWVQLPHTSPKKFFKKVLTNQYKYAIIIIVNEREVNGMYRSAIVDELGEVMYWCSDLTKEEVYQILCDHPEWDCNLIEIE